VRLLITERKEIKYKKAHSRRTIRNALRMHENLMHLLRQNEGLTILEYAVAAGLIAAAIAATFGVLGATINAIIATVVAFM